MEGLANRRSFSWGWLFALLGITSVSVGIFAVAFAVDAASCGGPAPGDLLGSPRVRDVMSNMPEVIAAVLGIAITVVAIIVELAANRYTHRITELFIGSPTNLAVLGFFVVTTILCVWTSLAGASESFVPRVGMGVTIFAITACLLMLLPYFAFVFSFLNPHNIIEHMASSALLAIHRGGRGRGHRAKAVAVRGVEQLADVALNAIENKDKVICMHAVDTLGRLTLRYRTIKDRLDAEWFRLDEEVRENTDFVSMQAEVIREIEERRDWLEMKVLRQYQMLYGETLNRMRDLNYLIAIDTRKIAEDAMTGRDRHVVNLAVKFFNTYMRATINAGDVRTAYNVFNQYRLLAQSALEKGQDDVAVEIALRFQYYGQLGFNAGLAFLLETAAYDLCSLNELAYELDAPCRDDLLGIFLEVDKEAEEGHELEASLRGVRKAQIKLATHYLERGADGLARRIADDMRSELPSRLKSIREELASITSKEFWEISDRGVNFDYLEPERRAQLEVFFGWFPDLDG